MKIVKNTLICECCLKQGIEELNEWLFCNECLKHRHSVFQKIWRIRKKNLLGRYNDEITKKEIIFYLELMKVFKIKSKIKQYFIDYYNSIK